MDKRRLGPGRPMGRQPPPPSVHCHWCLQHNEAKEGPEHNPSPAEVTPKGVTIGDTPSPVHTP
ncbi:unnamed protein product [Natator depressus]